MNEKKIIVFCGAFNPPTVAHFHAAQLAIEKIDADLLLWVPSQAAYIRDVQHKERVFNDRERVEMLLRMLTDYNDSYKVPGSGKMTYCTLELSQETQPKTYETLDAVQKCYRDAQVYLLMGSDKLQELEHGWANIEYLLGHYKVIILPRFDENVQSIINSNTFLSAHKDAFVICDQGVKEQMLSSTQARESIRKLETELAFLKQILPKSVLMSILQKMEKKLQNDVGGYRS